MFHPIRFPHSRFIARVAALVLAAATLAAAGSSAETGGLLVKDGRHLFPIGFYELPQSEEGLRAMACAGVNLVHCHSRADLDRVQAVGIQGVYPLPLQEGNNEGLRARVQEVADHPALAVWEGPDEVVWNFTAFSGLYRTMGVHKTPGEWFRQTPEAVAYAQEQAAQIIPNMRAAAAMIRSIDALSRPLWINEAQKSDVYYVRQYLDFIDITGCDIYPVAADKRPIQNIGLTTDRWNQVGRGKPVYMVLQAFSWNELGDYYGAKETAYPTFTESRFMAYDAIAHGADGILYWGSYALKSEAFRQSLYALTSELAALQPFLVVPEVSRVHLSVIEIPNPAAPAPSVRLIARQAGDDWLLVLINEDEESRMGVVVEGLHALEGRTFQLLYGDETVAIAQGELITRMQAREVKTFATRKDFESPRREGRDFDQ